MTSRTDTNWRIPIIVLGLAVAGCTAAPESVGSVNGSESAPVPVEAPESTEPQPIDTPTTVPSPEPEPSLKPESDRDGTAAPDTGAPDTGAPDTETPGTSSPATECQPCEAPDTAAGSAQEPPPEPLSTSVEPSLEPLFGDAETVAGRTVRVEGEIRYGSGALFSPAFKVAERGPGTPISPVEVAVRHDEAGMVDAIGLSVRGDLVLLGNNLGRYEATIDNRVSPAAFEPVELDGAGSGVSAATADEQLQAFLGMQAHHAFGTWVQLYPPGVLGDWFGSFAGNLAGGQPTPVAEIPTQGSLVYEGTMAFGYIGSDGGASLALADTRVELDAAARVARLTSSNTRLTAGIGSGPFDASTLDVAGTFVLAPAASSMHGPIVNAGDSTAGASEMTGSLDMRFYGPAGVELAGTLGLEGDGVEGATASFGLALRNHD